MHKQHEFAYHCSLKGNYSFGTTTKKTARWEQLASLLYRTSAVVRYCYYTLLVPVVYLVEKISNCLTGDKGTDLKNHEERPFRSNLVYTNI